MLAAVLVAGVSAVVDAQESRSGDARGAFATRAALEAQAGEAERAAQDRKLSAQLREFHRGEGWLIRRRLTEGDFVVGDRIVVRVVGEATLSDTFTVRAGPTLELGTLPPVSLAGVLRVELQPHLTTMLGRYIRQPEVTALPLVRVAVMGQVARPGYYYLPADMLLADVLMAAGGPAGNADLERSRIRRGDDALYSEEDVRIALADGMSLDALSLRSGDEFHLAERRRTDWAMVLRVASMVAGVVALISRFTS